MWQNQRLPKLARSASASIAYGNLTEIFDRANVAVQREVEVIRTKSFCNFTPETFALANVSQVLSK